MKKLIAIIMLVVTFTATANELTGCQVEYGKKYAGIEGYSQITQIATYAVGLPGGLGGGIALAAAGATTVTAGLSGFGFLMGSALVAACVIEPVVAERKWGRPIDLINDALDENYDSVLFQKFLAKVRKDAPDATAEEVGEMILIGNNGPFCDGTIVNKKRRKVAKMNEIRRFVVSSL